MPRKRPGMTVEFAVVSEDGSKAEMGTIRGPDAVLPMLVMKAVKRAVYILRDKPNEPAAGTE